MAKTKDEILDEWIQDLEDTKVFLRGQLKGVQKNIDEVTQRLEALRVAKDNLALAANVKKELN